jgi:transposase
MERKFEDVPDELWACVESKLPAVASRERGGRPRVSDRRVLAGIVYRLRTGCQWKALPRQFGSGSTCHRRFQSWCSLGLFVAVFADMVKFYDLKRGVDLKWASLDSAMVKAPKGGI